jgi:hypothetical protein
MTHRALSKSRRDTWSWSRRSLLSFTEFTSPSKLPSIYQISILRRLLVSNCWRKSRFGRAFQPPAPIWIQHPGIQTKSPLRSYLQRSEQHSAHIWCKPQSPFDVSYKDQNNTQFTYLVQTNNPLRSHLQRWEEHRAHINISLVEAPTIKYYYYSYYFCILEDARMHNVTMRIVANRFDDALHIAFGETLLAAHERWMGSSLTMWIGPLKEYLVDGRWSAPATRAACHMPVNEWMNEWRKEGRTDGRTTNW